MLAGGVVDFLWLGVGGLVFGAAVGLACSWLLAPAEDSRIEITLTTVCAFASFLGAGYVGVSEVMAVIGAGLTVGNYGRTKISPHVIQPLEHYWAYLAFAANSIVFLLVGLSLRADGLLDYAGAIAVAVAAVLVARAAGIFPLMPLVNRLSERPVERAGPDRDVVGRHARRAGAGGRAVAVAARRPGARRGRRLRTVAGLAGVAGLEALHAAPRIRRRLLHHPGQRADADRR